MRKHNVENNRNKTLFFFSRFSRENVLSTITTVPAAQRDVSHGGMGFGGDWGRQKWEDKRINATSICIGDPYVLQFRVLGFRVWWGLGFRD